MTAYYNEFDPKAAAWLRQLIKNGNIARGEVDERSITEVTASDLNGFSQHHFFAGIGVWSYALRNAGWDDSRSVWTASLPCQPFSVAGNQKGKDDERHLLPHFIELVKQCRPNTIFGEQVESAIRHEWLDDLQTNMEGEGYALGHCVLGAHSVGKAHIRKRLYWVASGRTPNTESDGSGGGLRQVSSENEEQQAHQESGQNQTEQLINVGSDNGVADSLGNENNQKQQRPAEAKRERSSIESSGCGLDNSAIGLANSNRQGLQGRGGHEQVDGAQGGEKSMRHTGESDICSGLGNAKSEGQGGVYKSGGESSRENRRSSDGDESRLVDTNPNGHKQAVRRVNGEKDGTAAIDRENVIESRQLRGASSDVCESIEWLYCRDNKYRPIKSFSFEMVDGSTRGMGYCGNTVAQVNAEKEGEVNGTEDKTNTCYPLQSLPNKTREKANQRETGGFNGVQEKEVLQQGLHGKGLRGCDENTKHSKQSPSVKEASERILRGVWERQYVTCSSCGRESIKQLNIKLDDIMCEMPHGSTLETLFKSRGAKYMQSLRQASDEKQSLLDAQYSLSEIWQSLDDESKERAELEFNNRGWMISNAIKPLVDGIARGVVHSVDSIITPNDTAEARAQRLKGYGNAIVAPVAEEFIRAFMDSNQQ